MSAARPGAGLAVKVAPPHRPAPPAPRPSGARSGPGRVALRGRRRSCSPGRTERGRPRSRAESRGAGGGRPGRGVRDLERTGGAGGPSLPASHGKIHSPSQLPDRTKPARRSGAGRRLPATPPSRSAREPRAGPRAAAPSGEPGGLTPGRQPEWRCQSPAFLVAETSIRCGGFRIAGRIRHFRCSRLAHINSLKK